MIPNKTILYSLLMLISNFIFGKDIVIDNSFKQLEIYSTLNKYKNNTQDSIFKFDIKNTTAVNKQLYISIINPTIDKIEIIDNNKSTILGDAILFKKRVFKHSNFIYPLELNASESRQLYIKIHKQWEPLAFTIKLDTENSFIKHSNHDNIFLGFFLGIFFMFLMLLICFYIFSRSNYFILYAVINIFSLIFYFLYTGIGYQYIWSFSVLAQKYIIIVAIVGYFYSHILFIKSFFTSQFKKISYQTILNTILIICLVFSAVLLILQIIKTPYFISFNAFYDTICILFCVYTISVFSLSFYAFNESKRREILWIAVTMLLHIFNWFIFLNTIYGRSEILNKISGFQLFNSSIFVSQINLILTLVELLFICIFVVFNYHFLVRKNNLTYKRLEYLQKRNINTFVLGQEEEREKITDSIDNTLKIDIKNLEKRIEQFQQHSNENKVIPTVLKDLHNTLQDLKNITSNYVTPDLQNMYYYELIHTSTDKLNAEKNVTYVFDTIKDDFKLNAIANAHIYRICQELSNNIFKHANATEVTIQSKIDQHDLILKFIDNGKGFIEHNQKGIGLLNIESRINSLNGNIYFLSNEKRGTIIHIILTIKDII